MYCVAFLFLLSGKTLSYLISWKKFALDRNLNLDLFIIRVGINRFLWLLIELPHFDRFVQFIFYNKVRNFWPLFVTDLVPRIFSCLVLLQITFYKCFFSNMYRVRNFLSLLEKILFKFLWQFSCIQIQPKFFQILRSYRDDLSTRNLGSLDHEILLRHWRNINNFVMAKIIACI